MHVYEEIHQAILFMSAQDRFSYMYFVMVDFDSFKRKLIPFASLKGRQGDLGKTLQRKSGRSFLVILDFPLVSIGIASKAR